MQSFPKRRRATAIVEYPDGILITVMRYMSGSLPGGGVKTGETDEEAVVRELHEETGLVAAETVFLFRYESLARDHAVYWVRAEGMPAACGETDQIGYYCKGATLKVSPESLAIIDRFLAYKAERQEDLLVQVTAGV
jgi:8-oxo-dGTP diphosphatase